MCLHQGNTPVLCTQASRSSRAPGAAKADAGAEGGERRCQSSLPCSRGATQKPVAVHRTRGAQAFTPWAPSLVRGEGVGSGTQVGAPPLSTHPLPGWSCARVPSASEACAIFPQALDATRFSVPSNFCTGSVARDPFWRSGMECGSSMIRKPCGTRNGYRRRGRRAYNGLLPGQASRSAQAQAWSR